MTNSGLFGYADFSFNLIHTVIEVKDFTLDLPKNNILFNRTNSPALSLVCMYFCSHPWKCIARVFVKDSCRLSTHPCYLRIFYLKCACLMPTFHFPSFFNECVGISSGFNCTCCSCSSGSTISSSVSSKSLLLVYLFIINFN